MKDTDSGARLLSVVARLNRWATRHADLPLPAAQARLLVLIEQLGEGRIGELAELDHCSQPTMTTQVQRLERAGFVDRRADPEDGRASVVRLTSAGHDKIADVRAARSATLARVLDGATPAQLREIDAAIAVIEKVLEAAEQD